MRQRQQEQEIMCLRAGAAITIQTCFRQYIACKHFTRTKTSTIIIQRWWRTIKQQQVIRAAVIIQCAYRVHLATNVYINALQQKQHTQQQEALEESMAIRIQAAWRGYDARAAYTQLRRASICIQAGTDLLETVGFPSLDML